MHFLRAGHEIPKDAWSILSSRMAAEPSIMTSRATSKGMQRVFEDGYAVLLWNGDQPAGFIAAWETTEGYREIGTAWVAPNLRGHGHSIMLVAEIVRLIHPNGHSRTFAISTNQKFVGAARHNGMRMHTDWTNPIPWSATCGTCDMVPAATVRDCRLRNVFCHLLLCPGADF